MVRGPASGPTRRKLGGSGVGIGLAALPPTRDVEIAPRLPGSVGRRRPAPGTRRGGAALDDPPSADLHHAAASGRRGAMRDFGWWSFGALRRRT